MSAGERREEVSEGPVCRRLRTKTAFGTLVGDCSLEAAPWESGASTTAVYWCLGTMSSCGPDDQLAHPHECRGGRSCYAAPLDD